MTGFIGTSLQLQSIIAAHTLNSFWTTSVLRMLYVESLELTNELPFTTAREPNKDHRLQGFHYCSSWIRCLGNVHEPLPSKTGNSVSFFFLWRYSPNLGLGLPPWYFPFHFGLLDLRHSVRLLRRVISSSQGLYLYTNTEKWAYTPNIHALSGLRTHDPGFRAS
jgi:hypothetical protein